MKKIFLSLASLCLLILVACSGGSTSYNPETCAQLKAMTEEKKEFSENDWNQMIDQMVAACKVLNEKRETLGDDKDATRDFMLSDDGRQLLEYAMGFAIYLETHKSQMPEASLKKLESAKAEIEALGVNK